jgi:hypothetical protein
VGFAVFEGVEVLKAKEILCEKGGFTREISGLPAWMLRDALFL